MSHHQHQNEVLPHQQQPLLPQERGRQFASPAGFLAKMRPSIAALLHQHQQQKEDVATFGNATPPTPIALKGDETSSSSTDDDLASRPSQFTMEAPRQRSRHTGKNMIAESRSYTIPKSRSRLYTSARLAPTARPSYTASPNLARPIHHVASLLVPWQQHQDDDSPPLHHQHAGTAAVAPDDLASSSYDDDPLASSSNVDASASSSDSIMDGALPSSSSNDEEVLDDDELDDDDLDDDDLAPSSDDDDLASSSYEEDAITLGAAATIIQHGFRRQVYNRSFAETTRCFVEMIHTSMRQISHQHINAHDHVAALDEYRDMTLRLFEEQVIAHPHLASLRWRFYLLRAHVGRAIQLNVPASTGSSSGVGIGNATAAPVGDNTPSSCTVVPHTDGTDVVLDSCTAPSSIFGMDNATPATFGADLSDDAASASLATIGADLFDDAASASSYVHIVEDATDAPDRAAVIAPNTQFAVGGQSLLSESKTYNLGPSAVCLASLYWRRRDTMIPTVNSVHAGPLPPAVHAGPLPPAQPPPSDDSTSGQCPTHFSSPDSEDDMAPTFDYYSDSSTSWDHNGSDY